MSRRSKKQQSGSFGRSLGWTLVLALVFSAGLITGQRLLRQESVPPLVSLSMTRPAAEVDAPKGEDEAEKPKRTFSFYDQLTGKVQPREKAQPAPAKGAKPAKPAKEEKSQEKPTADKPAQKEKETAAPAPEEKAQAPAAEAAKEPETAEKPERTVRGVLENIVAEAIGADERKDDAGEQLPARYTLQISAHPDKSAAEREMDRLRSMGFEPHVVMVEVPGKGRFFRVRVGKFHSMDEARNFQAELQQRRGVSSFVSPL